mmetsp:Transcript_18305/g.38161  ORF Transcript_18305/g.38161 Transcript_18305/m.38161 type:complete len:90 (-) Transcript_18305:564-833(-)
MGLDSVGFDSILLDSIRLDSIRHTLGRNAERIKDGVGGMAKQGKTNALVVAPRVVELTGLNERHQKTTQRNATQHQTEKHLQTLITRYH